MLNPFETYNKLITKPKEIQKEMVVTIYISSNPTYIHMPIFKNYRGFKIDRNVRIEWGDGQSNEVYNGQSLNAINTTLNHKYTTTGYKEVKIISEDGTLSQWSSQSGTYGSSSRESSSDCIAEHTVRYDTPFLKFTGENQTSVSLNAGITSVNLEYVNGYLFKNNSHLTALPNFYTLRSPASPVLSGQKGCTFILERNILLDLPNLTSINYFTYLFSKQQTNYDVELLFEGCPKIESLDMFSSWYYDIEGGRFPNMFKNLPNLTAVYCGSTNSNSSTSSMNLVTSIPEDLFRCNPKLKKCRKLFTNQVSLDTSNISFTKGGFFAENWEPDSQLDMVEFMPSVNANTVNTGSAQELYETLQTLPNGYDATSAIYNNTKMVGYSSVPSSWRTNPF